MIHREALHERIRMADGKPLFSLIGKIAEEIIFSLLTLYERLLRNFDFKGVSNFEAMWLLIEDVFVPTVFNILIRQWHFGLGTELQGESCWYLPTKSQGVR